MIVLVVGEILFGVFCGASIRLVTHFNPSITPVVEVAF